MRNIEVIGGLMKVRREREVGEGVRKGEGKRLIKKEGIRKEKGKKEDVGKECYYLGLKFKLWGRLIKEG